ncbi:unnamed protein product, partial [Nesidiocoris tenuis]
GLFPFYCRPFCSKLVYSRILYWYRSRGILLIAIGSQAVTVMLSYPKMDFILRYISGCSSTFQDEVFLRIFLHSLRIQMLLH